MEIGLLLLLDEFGFDAEVNLLRGENAWVSGVELFSPKGPDLSGKKLLVCTLSEALSVPKRDGLCFLCTRDKRVDVAETPEAMHGIIVVRKPMDVRELFNHAQRAFMHILDWVMAMENSIARNEGLQELLTLSEPIFRNHISVQDSTFKLLAHTRGIDPPDHVSAQLVHLGYHPPETMELFKKLRRIEEFERSHDIVVSEDHGTSEYTTVKKMFHCGGAVSFLVVMICNGREATEGLKELYGILLERIRFYVERDFQANSDSDAQTSLVRDLVAKNVGNQEEAKIRAMYAGLPFDGQFCLSVMVFQDETNVPYNQMVRSFSLAFPEAVVCSDRKHLLLLDVGQCEHPPEWEAQVKRLAENHAFRCGISDAFGCLMDLHFAYTQVFLALETAARLRPEVVNQRQFFTFRDYWVYHLLASGAQAAPAAYKSSFYFRVLDRLRAYDEEHHINTMQLLRVYLECERKATVASAQLHMHRNTVLYHIERVEKMLDISFDDPDTRLMLLLAYKTEDFEANNFFFHY